MQQEMDYPLKQVAQNNPTAWGFLHINFNFEKAHLRETDMSFP
jgi:hypothetical protein